MIIKTSDFVTSAANADGYPGDRPESPSSAVWGQVHHHQLDHRPTRFGPGFQYTGQDTAVNFFNINNEMYLVDLPGYGYAKVSGTKEVFGRIAEEYFNKRSSLKRVVLLLDSRHKPTGDDVLMYRYLKHFDIQICVIATKLDKLKRNEIRKNEKLIRDTLEMDPAEELIMYSALTKENKDIMMEKIFDGLLAVNSET